MNETVDLAIIGAGPAGLSAACEARELGLDVVLLDDQSAAGGQIYRAVDSVGAERKKVLGEDYFRGAELTSAFANSGSTHVAGASVWNIARDRTLSYLHQGRSHSISPQQLILASGAMERPFPIEGWTLPGVMGAGAAQVLLKGSGATPVEPVVLAGCGPLLYLLAAQYIRAGVSIQALVLTTSAEDYLRAGQYLLSAMRGWRDLAKGLRMMAAIHNARVPVYTGAEHLIVEGKEHAEALSFLHRGKRVRLESRLVLLHHGVVPNTQLSLALEAKHRWSESQLAWLPETDRHGQIGDTGIYVAGDSRGIVGAKASAVQGRLAAVAAASKLGKSSQNQQLVREQALSTQLKLHMAVRPFLDALYRPRDANRIPTEGSVVVCRCEEVTASQIRKFVSLGCQGPNQAKAFGRCGMGPCQGRLCGLTVSEIMARERDVSVGQVGYYRIRPPIKPISLGEL